MRVDWRGVARTHDFIFWSLPSRALFAVLGGALLGRTTLEHDADGSTGNVTSARSSRRPERINEQIVVEVGSQGVALLVAVRVPLIGTLTQRGMYESFDH